MPQGTIFLIDDNPAFRQSTQWLLESHGLRVVDFAEGRAFLDSLAAEGCDRDPACVLLDIRMPGLSGLQIQEELRVRGATLPIIFITAHSDVPLVVQAMRRGAFNFMEKPFSAEALLAEVVAALTQDGEQMQRDRQNASARSCLESLTPRERQVLEWVAAGALNKTIADKLGISVKTVELHRSRVMEKMRAGSLAQLVQITLRAQGEGGIAQLTTQTNARAQ
jgi:two-component system, LuxR family, response regulator FixJ